MTLRVIFLTMSRFYGVSCKGIYPDLMRKIRNEGHQVYIIAPCERSSNMNPGFISVDGVHIVKVKTLNLQKTNIIEKGIGQLLLETQYKRAIKHYLKDVKFDLILYSTPPISFPKVLKFLKRKNPGAKSFLLLKDIFPQNAVDLGMLSKRGLKGVLYSFYRRKEKKLYALSDSIGCMSPANVEYVLKHNSEIEADRVLVAPNSIELKDEELLDSKEIKRKETVKYLNIKSRYGIPTDRPVFIFGGNLGKPQGIPFLIECLSANASRQDCFFVIVGTGTEMPLLKKWYTMTKPQSVKVLDGLPKDEYDELVRACDVGLIFLDYRFTIPNYPSRLLSYLENKMPVLCATDPNTDIGRIAEENDYGFWCESNSVERFTVILDRMIHSDYKAMGKKGFEFLKKNYLIDNTYYAIMSHV